MSATSLAAYRVVRPSARETRVKILDFARARGPYGFTADELAEAWACSHNHVSPRCTELLKSGLLVPAGRTRPTRTGHPAGIMVAARFAQPTPAQPELELTGAQNWRDPA